MAKQRKEVEQVEQPEQANANERAAVAFLAESLGAFLSRSDLTKMTVQNDYGAISVSRELPEREQVHAIGFAADYDEYDEDDGDGVQWYDGAAYCNSSRRGGKKET